jgi:hypothetical protein
LIIRYPHIAWNCIVLTHYLNTLNHSQSRVLCQMPSSTEWIREVWWTWRMRSNLTSWLTLMRRSIWQPFLPSYYQINKLICVTFLKIILSNLWLIQFRKWRYWSFSVFLSYLNRSIHILRCSSRPWVAIRMRFLPHSLIPHLHLLLMRGLQHRLHHIHLSLHSLLRTIQWSNKRIRTLLN